MLIPVMTVLVNLWLTMRGRLGNVHSDIGGKFVFAGPGLVPADLPPGAVPGPARSSSG